MKKTILVLSAIVCTLSVGCSRIEKAQSLEEAYYNVTKKIENKEKISKKYIANLLKGYDYKLDKELILEQDFDGEKHIQKPYVFTNGDETLTLTHMITGDEKSVSPSYSFKNDYSQTSLGYLESSYDDESESNNKFIFSTMLNDIKKHEYISKKLESSKNNWKEIYYNIANNATTTNDIKIEDIKKLLNIEPKVEEEKFNPKIYFESNTDEISHSKLTLVNYSFETDDNWLSVSYIKEINKIWHVFYNDKNTSTILNIMNKNMLNKNEKLHTGIITYVNSIEEQQKLLKEISNYL